MRRLKSLSGRILFLWLLIVGIIPMNVGYAQDDPASKIIKRFTEEFKTDCPQPRWWDRVSVDNIRIKTREDLFNYWLDQHRTDRQFFKAAYQSILDHPLDANLIVEAIRLMNLSDPTYPHRSELLTFALKHFRDYKTPDTDYPAESIALIVEDLMEINIEGRNYDYAIQLFKDLTAKRRAEINDSTIELLCLEYAKALYGLKKTDAAVSMLKAVLKYHHGEWDNRIREDIRWYEHTLSQSRPIEQRSPTDHNAQSTPKPLDNPENPSGNKVAPPADGHGQGGQTF